MSWGAVELGYLCVVSLDFLDSFIGVYLSAINHTCLISGKEHTLIPSDGGITNLARVINFKQQLIGQPLKYVNVLIK